MTEFISKHLNLRLTRRPHLEIATPTGAYRTIAQPMRYDFAPSGALNVDEGQDVLPDGDPIIEDGKIKRDEHGNVVFETQDALSWLRSRPEYNNPEMVGGFTEVGREPEHIPDAAPRVREIFAAAFAGDRDLLEEYQAEEDEAAYSRPAVDAALEESFANVDAQAKGTTPEEQRQSGGTDGNDAHGASGGDDLDALGMKDLRVRGKAVGLSFPPGTSLVEARNQLRAVAERNRADAESSAA